MFRASFTDAVETAFRHRYSDFSGCTGVAQFGYVIVFDMLMFVPVGLLGLESPVMAWLLAVILSSVLIYPTLAAVVRRFHDAGRSGKLAAGQLVGMMFCGLIIRCLCEDNMRLYECSEHVIYALATVILLMLCISMVITLMLPTYDGATKWNLDETQIHRKFVSEEVAG